MTSRYLPFLVLAAACASSCAPIKPVALVPFADGKDWMVTAPLRFDPSDGSPPVVVPTGFVTDFASAPRAAWPVIPPVGRYQHAAVVHDYLYWTQKTTRDKADDYLLGAMKDSGVNGFQRWAIDRSVRAGGWSAWKKNAEERQNKMPRIIPPSHRNIPANVTWAQYRQYLHSRGIYPAKTE